jgi:hypothetical protein
LKKCYILILFVIIVFGTYTYLIQKHRIQTANEYFMHYISEADSCFELDYSKLDEQDKISYYMQASSNLLDSQKFYKKKLTLLGKIIVSF